MTRRQLAFVVLLNGLVSLVIALAVVWVAEQRRPDLAALLATRTPAEPVVILVTPTPMPATPTPQVAQAPTPPPPTPTPAPSPGEDGIYIVQPGDSLFGIALDLGVTLEALMEANNITDPDRIFSGQRLIIPGGPQDSGSSSAASSAPEPPPAPVTGLVLRVENPGDLAQENALVINDGDTAVNLEGWQLRRPGGPAFTFGNHPLFPGGSVRVHTRAGTADSLNLYWGQGEPLWRSGDTVELVDPQGRVVAQTTVP